jgi:amino acid transporter
MNDHKSSEAEIVARDMQTLHSMGYAQELSRRMKGFSNFAISFSIICILSGGINSLGQAIAGAGGASIGIGWPLGCLVSLIFALGMAQIASAYPTAGGLYHWSSILGGRGWGWATAWLNLLGLVTVLGAINVGTFFFFMGAFGADLKLTADLPTQIIFVVLITAAQAAVNHFGIGLTTKLTDASGYLIFAVTGVLTIALLAYAPTHDIARLWTFTNNSGLPSGSTVWPQTSSLLGVFLLGLLLPIYTITGFDASAHTSEETQDAQRAVPRGIVTSVLYSGIGGWIMLCAFVIAIPNMDDAAKQGYNVFFDTMGKIIPSGLRYALYIGIFISQFLCGLATVTSVSRMIFAFARDGGFPSFLRGIHANFRTPVAAIWTGAFISILFTLYAPVYSTIVSVTVIFLFLSYGMPIGAGLLAYGKSWTKMGPWNLGGLFQIVAAGAIAGVLLIFAIGIQPPNDKALYATVGLVAVLIIAWFALERNRFTGPPTGESIAKRQAEIARAEQALSGD